VISEEGEFVSEKSWFIKFYLPWCPKCKLVADIWEDFASKDLDINIGDVDCDQQKKICSEYGINSYPTILYFPADAGY